MTKPVLTIGCATIRDWSGLYFTFQSILFHHPEVRDQIELIAVDNDPAGGDGQAIKWTQERWWGDRVRYIPFTEKTGTAAPRDLIFREARGEYVLCLDSHVLLQPKTLALFLAYYAAHPETNDLLQGPLVYDDCQTVTTHMEPVWRSQMFGIWAPAKRRSDLSAGPMEIPMHGLGLFSCRKAAWPGFNPRFTGFGGEEGYIHEKFRQRGARTLCLPWLQWVHRFGRSHSVPYQIALNDKVWNYCVGWREIGWPIEPVREHFAPEYMTEKVFDAVLALADAGGEAPKWEVIDEKAA